MVVDHVAMGHVAVDHVAMGHVAVDHVAIHCVTGSHGSGGRPCDTVSTTSHLQMDDQSVQVCV